MHTNSHSCTRKHALEKALEMKCLDVFGTSLECIGEFERGRIGHIIAQSRTYDQLGLGRLVKGMKEVKKM